MIQIVKQVGKNEYIRTFLDKVGEGFLVRYEKFSYEEKDGEKIELVWHEFPITLPYALLKEGKNFKLFKLEEVPIDEYGRGSIPENCYYLDGMIEVEFEVPQRWVSDLVTVKGYYVRDIKEELEDFLRDILERDLLGNE